MADDADFSQVDTRAIVDAVSDLAANADSVLHALSDTEGLTEAETEANLLAAVEAMNETAAAAKIKGTSKDATAAQNQTKKAGAAPQGGAKQNN